MNTWWIVVAGLIGLVVGFTAATIVLRRRLDGGGDIGDEDPAEMDRDSLRVLSVLSSTIILIDREEEIMRASPEAYSFGLVRNDALVQPDLRAMVGAVRADQRVHTRELLLQRSALEGSGQLRLDVRVAPLAHGIVLVMVNDTTEQLRLEETRRDFVANVSHELKTPVGAIGLLAETVEECADDPDTVRHFSHRMQVESNRLAALVKEIIDLSRLQEPDALRNPVAVDLDAVVAESVDSVRMAAEDRNITIVVGGDPEAHVYGDHAMLVMAVRNLLENAVRHSHPAGRVSLGVSRNEDAIRIAVVDQGEGIPSELHDRVFERFFRADPARSRETGGTGLGLSIVKHVAADHGGRVELWSMPGKGATFTIVLPILEAPSRSENDPMAPAAPDDEEM